MLSIIGEVYPRFIQITAMMMWCGQKVLLFQHEEFDWYLLADEFFVLSEFDKPPDGEWCECFF